MKEFTVSILSNKVFYFSIKKKQMWRKDCYWKSQSCYSIFFNFCFSYSTRLQRSGVSFRLIFGLRNAKFESETDKRFSLCRHVHIQCGSVVRHNDTGNYDNSFATRRQFRFHRPVHHILLFPVDGAYICTEGTYFFQTDL